MEHAPRARSPRLAAIGLSLVAVGFGWWSAGPAGAHGEGGEMTFAVEDFKGEMIDGGPEGHGIGDQFVFFANLAATGDHTAKSAHDTVGHVGGQCVMVAEGTGQCSATMMLKGGQIAVQGMVHHAAHEAKATTPADGHGGGMAMTLAVVGGTGDHSGSSGEIHVEHAEDAATVTVHLD